MLSIIVTIYEKVESLHDLPRHFGMHGHDLEEKTFC